MKKKITIGLCVVAFISYLGISNCIDANATDLSTINALADKADKVENINCNKAYDREVCVKINNKEVKGKRHD